MAQEREAAPEPSRAELARQLVEARHFGVLSTQSLKMPGYPFGSVVTYAMDSQGRPLLLLSELAVHTRNLDGEPKCSLTVFAESGADPLAAPRATLLGDVQRVPEDELEKASARYLSRHPQAEQYLGFGDFALYRLAVQQAYYVGGFGEMGWVPGRDYESAY